MAAIVSSLPLMGADCQTSRLFRPGLYGRLALAIVLGIVALAPQALLARLPTRVEGRAPREYWQFLFFYESTRAPGQIERIWHPFYGVYENQEKAYSYRRALYPIFYSHGTNHWNHWTMLYFFSGDDVYREEADEGDSDWLLSPFFQMGGGAGEDYWSVFPFYGRLRNKLGYSEINYVLFPLYASWSYRDYHARGILWPLTMWGGGDDRDDLRIFPFYSQKIHRGKYDRRTLLWPFFQWGDEALDKVEPRHYFFSFPLVGRKWSDQGQLNAWTFLWLPFLGGFVAWGEDKKTNSFSFNALWFIYQYQRSDDPHLSKHVIFPFYGYYRFGNTDDDAETYYNEALFITPLFAALHASSAVVDSEYTYLFPFYTNNTRHFRKERESDWHLKIWPLFQITETSGGRSEFRSLVLWPFRADQFERDWGVFYALTEWSRYENGDRYFSLLFRLYSRYWNENEEHHFFIGFEWHNTPAYWNFCFLGGLFGLRRDFPAGGDPYFTMQLFWIDLPLGGPPPATTETLLRPLGAPAELRLAIGDL
ncbi:MAG: hypothetical protein K1X75_00220 [Leptospirales bacterium]|nr:hypothetical protein [Leptospirales bacterium]